MALFFAVTLFVSAFLLFLVQPMVGRMVLPLLGGTPAVWATCMVFFQALLLAGYAYAHAATSRLGARRQAALHLAVLALPLVVLGLTAAFTGAPVRAFPALAPQGQVYPFFGVIVLLAAAIGLPFFVVATSAPLLQRWFADTAHPAARDPYFLYAASNFGSLLALVAYPAFVERHYRLSEQGWVWSAGYLALAVLTAGCALQLRRSAPAAGGGGGAFDAPAPAPVRGVEDSAPATRPAPATRSTTTVERPAQPAESPPPRWTDRLWWLALAFVPSSLLLGVTEFLTTDIAPIPLLWVIPLGLYLLTFVIAFGRHPAGLPQFVAMVTPVGLLILLFLLVSDKKPDSWGLNLVIHLGVFLLAALNCHLELARRRPAAGRLTEFYLWVSLGGVLGGLFNALLAPLVFVRHTEYPLALVFACLLQPPGGAPNTSRPARLLDWLVPLNVAGVTVLLLWLPSHWLPPAVNFPIPWYGPWGITGNSLWTLLVYGGPLVACYFWVERPLRFGLSVAAVFLAGTIFTAIQERNLQHVIYRGRSYFGVVSVERDVDEETGGDVAYHKLVHGTTLHGKQRWDPPDDEPLSYYHHTGPIGQVFEAAPPAVKHPEIALIGLGSGTMTTYGAPGQTLTIYEIDPAVLRIAEDPQYFTYLKDCKAKYAVVLGDARLKLADHGRPGQYGVIVVDAFSSDAIPVHLLTKEAVELYVSRLAPDGIIALHISNRFLDLKPVAARIAQELGLAGLEQYDDDMTPPGKQRSQWVILARKRADFAGLPDLTHEVQKDDRTMAVVRRWSELKADAGAPLWTDDYSNLLQIFNWDRLIPWREN